MRMLAGYLAAIAIAFAVGVPVSQMVSKAFEASAHNMESWMQKP